MSTLEHNPIPEEGCRFCEAKLDRRLIAEGRCGFAAYDRHPASEGHFLVIPYRHFANYFEINDDELVDLWGLVVRAQKIVHEKYQPDGYNIGINVGTWAGQSISHLHIHVIPRYKGDVENPKGGVRGVIPHKKLYDLAPEGQPESLNR
jgi:diadenosine tetraphosphate (Ap4A) HIT family hydrolase